MSEARLEKSGSPKGILRLLLRAPVPLYRIGLGFLFGRRFVMIEHTGRVSGQRRFAVLEVVANLPEAVYVMAGWGRQADWYRNLRAHPVTRVRISTETYETSARFLDSAEAGAVLAGYASRHPKALKRLSAMMLDQAPDDPDGVVAQMSAALPMVALPRP